MTVVSSVAALAAVDPQLSLAGVALMRSVVLVAASVVFVGGHQQAPLVGVTLVVFPVQARV